MSSLKLYNRPTLRPGSSYENRPESGWQYSPFIRRRYQGGTENKDYFRGASARYFSFRVGTGPDSYANFTYLQDAELIDQASAETYVAFNITDMDHTSSGFHQTIPIDFTMPQSPYLNFFEWTYPQIAQHYLNLGNAQPLRTFLFHSSLDLSLEAPDSNAYGVGSERLRLTLSGDLSTLDCGLSCAGGNWSMGSVI